MQAMNPGPGPRVVKTTTEISQQGSARAKTLFHNFATLSLRLVNQSKGFAKSAKRTPPERSADFCRCASGKTSPDCTERCNLMQAPAVPTRASAARVKIECQNSVEPPATETPQLKALKPANTGLGHNKKLSGRSGQSRECIHQSSGPPALRPVMMINGRLRDSRDS